MPSWRKLLQYRVAGLPNALRRHRPDPDEPLALLRRAYRRSYWRPRSRREWSTLAAALVAWPFVLLRDSRQAVRANGQRIEALTGKSTRTQFIEIIGHYFRSSILPPYYYIFSLYDPGGRERARRFLNRFETKVGLYDITNRGARSTLSDKAAFAERCRAHGVPTVDVLMTLPDDSSQCTPLPDRDLFVKPVSARGGTGAERWDSVGNGLFRSPGGKILTAGELLDQLKRKAEDRRTLVQPRLVNHPDIADLSNGALCTVRVMTCLNEERQPELIAAVYRMAIGTNVTVDNFHAGGIAAAVDIGSGELSQASDLGRRERSPGWISVHPQNGARIEGRVLPLWDEVKSLAIRAHRAFADRIILGWDIAILADGPIVVEGNARPDVDIMQRMLRRGLGDGRAGELLAFHVRKTIGDI